MVKVYSNKNNELITTPPKDLEKIKTGGKRFRNE